MINPLSTSKMFATALFGLLVTLSSGQAQPTVNTPAPEIGFPGLGSMLVVVVLLVLSGIASLWLVRRRVGFSGAGPLKVVQTLHLGPRERIVLVEQDNTTHLIGVTPTSITMLASKNNTGFTAG